MKKYKLLLFTGLIVLQVKLSFGVVPDSLSSFPDESKAHLENKNIDLGNGVIMKMIGIPAGQFVMGTDISYSSAYPKHKVTISQPYWIAQTEVTQAQFEAVMGKNPSYYKDANYPVEMVALAFDAKYFCNKLTEREWASGRLSKEYEYALPTEAQWEYACVLGTGKTFEELLDEMGWHTLNADGNNTPVGKSRPTASGLYDMYGNVWELCRDLYGKYPEGAVKDPEGGVSAKYANFVLRGGNANNQTSNYRSGVRVYYYASNSQKSLGFRPVLQKSRPRLLVRSNEAWARVEISAEDGRIIREVGSMTADRIPCYLNRGETYRVRVSLDGFKEYTIIIVADWIGKKTHNVDLIKKSEEE